MSDDTWPWQPIATAPKDGTDILVACGPNYDPMYAIVSWDDDPHQIRGRKGWAMWWKDGYADDWAEWWQPIARIPTPGDAA